MQTVYQHVMNARTQVQLVNNHRMMMTVMMKPAPGPYKGTASHHNDVWWARNTKYITETQEGCLTSLSEGTKKKQKERSRATEVTINVSSGGRVSPVSTPINDLRTPEWWSQWRTV
jgi:hypothetical protein